jgi:hypothetical protein
LELQRKLIDAVACARFYEAGGIDAGERAHSMLVNLRLCGGSSAMRSGPSH